MSPWYSLTIGALTYATYMLVLKSLVTGDASVIVVVILGEALTTRKLLGMLLCLAAIAVFFLGSRAGGEPPWFCAASPRSPPGSFSRAVPSAPCSRFSS